jgi:hypothetical protein
VVADCAELEGEGEAFADVYVGCHG